MPGALLALSLAAFPASAAFSARQLQLPLPAAAQAPLAAPAPLAPAAARPPAPLFAGQGVYERRGVGLLAVDVKDSTALHLAIGNRRARALIATVLDHAENTSAAFDGRVVRHLGDGFLAVFPRYRDALEAAKAVQGGMGGLRAVLDRPELGLRAGVHAGRVLVDASGARPDVYGEPVETAVALAGKGSAGEIATAEGLFRPNPAGPSRPGLQLALAERRFTQAATLFAGLEDWPRMYERHGRKTAFAAVKAFHEHVARAVSRQGGTVVKTEGETVMASFPDAHGAVLAGAEIQRGREALRAAAPLGGHMRVKVGVSWGRVLREDRLEGPDYFGNAVNAAARLMKLSVDGEVLAGSGVLADAAARRLLASAPRERVRLKGFAEELLIARYRP
ncbi:MAG: hypothetical protein HY553_02405 [Elusimicrobia bacterium]|nr:hypothetical protein [Elusimicrobiota bacterium]